jgi:hypothetical protein
MLMEVLGLRDGGTGLLSGLPTARGARSLVLTRLLLTSVPPGTAGTVETRGGRVPGMAR